MAKNHPSLVVLSVMLLLITIVGTVIAQRTYHLEHEWVKICWEKYDLLPNEQYPVGVSFPKEYVEFFDTQPRVHNLDTGSNYTTIQAAIDDEATFDGHTIFIDEGVYFEHVVVGKSLSLDWRRQRR